MYFSPVHLSSPHQFRAVGKLLLALLLMLFAQSGSAAGSIQSLAAKSHSCAVTLSGALQCWGPNEDGQIGDGTTTPALTPINVIAGGVTAVATGEHHTCAVVSGALQCWGRNVDGQIGNGATSTRVLTRTTVIASGVTAVAVNYAHSCAIVSGALQCWGANFNGQIGTGSTSSNVPSPYTVFASGVSAVAVGESHTCAVVSGALQCWGRNSEGQIGTGSAGANVLTPYTTIASGVSTATAGISHTCALLSSAVQCWGKTTSGPIHVPISNNPLPTTIIASGATAVVAGGSHTCAVVSGALQCWGENFLGQIGNGYSRESVSLPYTVIASGVTLVAPGNNHTCAVANGDLSCWGSSFGGRLGNGSYDEYSTATVLSGATSIAAGDHKSCAAVAGVLKCWGNQVDGLSHSVLVPKTVIGSGATSGIDVNCTLQGGRFECLGNVIASGVTAASMGWPHVCAVVGSALQCWGENTSGEIGDGTLIDVATPTTIIASGVTTVSTGVGHTCAIVGGALQCWGRNDDGQIGNGSVGGNVLLPTTVIASGVTAVSAGQLHTCAIVSGALWCWGRNLEGQIGIGSTTSSEAAPTLVVASGVTAVASGWYFTCALVNGALQCWGDNQQGQLSFGSVTRNDQAVYSPTTLIASGVATMATGGDHMCVLLLSGVVQCWGDNANGQVGTPILQAVTGRPLLQVEGNAVVISDGASTANTVDGSDFGSRSVGSNTVRSFSIRNLGSAPLTLPANAASLTGSGFSISAQPGTSVAPNGSTSFNVTFAPSVAGSVNGTVSIALSSAGPFTFAIAATATAGAATTPGAPTAINAVVGNAQATVSFTAPASDGGSAITGYTATSNPEGRTSSGCTASPCTVTGLTNGTAYTFTVVATNSVGNSSASTASSSVTPLAAPTEPGAPTAVSASAGNAQASISFTVPASNGGSAITGYTATSNPGGLTSSGCTASPCTVTGLTNGTAYTFTVVATNSVGNSSASTASSSVTPLAAPTVPGAPTAVSASAGNAQASISFTVPASNGGSVITGYTATSNPGGLTSSGCTASPCTVTGLTNGTAYTFTVVATNSVGNSSASTASSSVTPLAAPTVPGAPTAVSASAGNAQASISFTAPASNGGSAITGYTATSNPGGLTSTGCTASPCTVTGLTNGTAYTFTVVATNSIGNSSASTASSSVTPVAPTPPVVPIVGGVNTVTLTNTRPVTVDSGSTLIIDNPNSVSGTVVSFNGSGGTPSTLSVGGNNLNLQPTTPGTQLTLAPSGNSVVVQLTQGSLNLSGNTSTQPLLGVGGNTVINLAAPNTQLQVTAGNGTTQLALSNGSITLPPTSNNASGTLFAGETATFDSQGQLLGIQLTGSPGNTVGLPSSPINSSIVLPTIPRLDGTTGRLPDQSFLNVLNQTLNAGQASSRSNISQNAQGGLTLQVGGAKVACAPIDGLSYNSSLKNGMTVKADGSIEVVSSGVKVTLVPMLHELARLNLQFPGSTLTVSKTGVVTLSSGAMQVSFRPSWVVSAGNPLPAEALYTVNELGQVVFHLESGERQILYPAFKDVARLLEVLRTLDPQASMTMDAAAEITVTLGTQKLRLKPDYAVVSTTRQESYWVDGDKVFLRYPDGTAQGFALLAE